MAIETIESLGWDGILSFGIVKEEKLKKAGFLAESENGLELIPAFFDALKDGKIHFDRTAKSKNSVTNYTRSIIVQILTNTTQGVLGPSQMELGTGTGTTSSTDTDLWSPINGTLKPCSTIQVYLTYYAQYICTWLSTDPIQGTWTEIGLKDTKNNLWAHSALTQNLTVNSGEMLIGQWTIQMIST